MIDSILLFLNSLTDIQITGIALGVMIILFYSTLLISGSWKLGILIAELVNCYNIVVYLTFWVDSKLRPLFPVWMTVVLLILPFVILLIEAFLFSDKKLEKQLGKTDDRNS